MWDIWVQSLGQKDLLEKEIAPHSSILAWRVPWTEEPGRLQSIEFQRVGHDWVTNTFTFFSSQSTLFFWTTLILFMGVYIYGYIKSHFLLLLKTSASMLCFCSSVEFSFFLLPFFLPFFFFHFFLFSFLEF